MEHPTDPLQMAVVLLLLLCSAGVSPDGKKKKTEAGMCDWPGDRRAGPSAPREERTSLVNHCITL